MGSMFQIRSQATSIFSSSAKRLWPPPGPRAASRQRGGVQVALVEHCSQSATTEVTMPGFHTDPMVQTAPPCRVAISRISSASLDAPARASLTLVHRRRTGVRGLAASR